MEYYEAIKTNELMTLGKIQYTEVKKLGMKEYILYYSILY